MTATHEPTSQVALTARMFAPLFEYPGTLRATANTVAQRDDGMAQLLDLPDAAERVALLIKLDCPEHADGFIEFADAIGTLTPAEREELYSTTFDFDPAVSLELGWHLFGESYKRGAFLVRMREALREYDIDEGRHLPDYLPTLLLLLDELDQEDGEALILEVILPAVEVVNKNLAERPPTPWTHALRGLQSLLMATVAESLAELDEIRRQTVAVAEAEEQALAAAATESTPSPATEGGCDG